MVLSVFYLCRSLLASSPWCLLCCSHKSYSEGAGICSKGSMLHAPLPPDPRTALPGRCYAGGSAEADSCHGCTPGKSRTGRWLGQSGTPSTALGPGPGRVSRSQTARRTRRRQRNRCRYLLMKRNQRFLGGCAGAGGQRVRCRGCHPLRDPQSLAGGLRTPCCTLEASCHSHVVVRTQDKERTFKVTERVIWRGWPPRQLYPGPVGHPVPHPV